MDPKDMSYYADLVKMRTFLEDYDFGSRLDFPSKKCKHSSKLIVSESDPKLGLELVAGYYIGDAAHGLWKNELHAWVYDSINNVDVDISLDQFDSSLDSIMILPADNNHLLQRCDKITQLFREGNLSGYVTSGMDEVIDSYRQSLFLKK